MQDDHARAHEALHAIPPDLPREEWHRAGRAAIAAGLNVDDLIEWSRHAGNFRSEQDVRSAFKTITPEGGTGPGTLYRIASEYGHQPKLNGDHKHQPKASNITVTPRPGQSAIDVWKRCEPATVGHPYIVRKKAAGVPLDGLRVLPADDPLHIGGNGMAGALVVPAYDAEGELLSLQLIPPEGKKMNLAGCPVAGASHIVGDGDGALYVVEGIGAAWAAWQATGHRAVVCFGWGNVRRVATALRQKEPDTRIVICPDTGKETDAAQIASDVGAAVARLPDGWPQNSDVGDYAEREGLEALQSLLEGAAPPSPPPPRYTLLTGTDLREIPPIRWRVRGVLPAEGLAALFGASGSGKSFLALDMAAAIAEGREWFGHRVTQAPVIYAALEGEAGFRLRVAAWEAAHGRDLPTGMHLLMQPFRLTDPDDVRDLSAVVPPGAVLILDTLNRAAPMADENASKDMGQILDAAKRLQAAFGGLVLLVHHSGKDLARGMRGHSSLHAALDAAIEVNRDGDRREWKQAKSKDGEDGTIQLFRLNVEPVGFDEYGDVQTSCSVTRDVTAPQIKAAKLPQGGNQKIVLDAIRPLFKDGEIGKPGVPPTRQSIPLDVAIGAGAARLTCPTDKRTSRTREALTGLIGRGVIGCFEGWLWLT